VTEARGRRTLWRSLKRAASPLKARLDAVAARARGRQCVHLLHVSKTGGTAVKHALRPHRSCRRHQLFLHPHGTRLRDIPPGDKVVFFLRDPVTRFVSAFNSRRNRGRPRYNVPWTAEEELAFGRFDSAGSLALALVSDDEEDRDAAVRAMRSIGLLRDRFDYWLESEDYLLSRSDDVLLIGLQESLDEDFEVLKDILHLPGSLVLPVDDVRAHRATPGGADALDNAARDALRQWYAADYRLLEACRGIRALSSPASPPPPRA